MSTDEGGDAASVYLIDTSSGELVPACLVSIGDEQFLTDIESVWGPIRRSAAARLGREGRAVDHGHWDWRNKAARVRAGYYRLVGVWCDGGWQGLMAVVRDPRPSLLGDGQMLYVDYLETAPWNYRPFQNPPRYAAVGSLLIRCAIQMSLAEGVEGRIGLHSLEDAERFYEDKVGMTRAGPDPWYHNLVYFELTPEAAVRFLGPRG